MKRHHANDNVILGVDPKELEAKQAASQARAQLSERLREERELQAKQRVNQRLENIKSGAA